MTSSGRRKFELGRMIIVCLGVARQCTPWRRAFLTYLAWYPWLKMSKKQIWQKWLSLSKCTRNRNYGDGFVSDVISLKNVMNILTLLFVLFRRRCVGEEWVKNPHSLSGVGVVLQFLCCEITCKQQKHAESTENESVHQGVLKVFSQHIPTAYIQVLGLVERSRTVRRRQICDGTFRRWWSQMFYTKKSVFLKYFKG